MRKLAKRMIIDGMPLQRVSQLTELSIEIIQELVAEVGANLDGDA